MTVDIATYKPTLRNQYQQLSFGIVQNGIGKEFTGINKLAQRFSAALLTERGSVKCNPNYGCNFIFNTKKGNVLLGNIRDSACLALYDLQEFLPSEESDTDPDDERFGSAEIASLTVNGDHVVIEFSVIARNGQTTNINVAL